MAVTYQIIGSTILTSSSASVSFSGIVSTYKDLNLKISARNSTANTGIRLTYNGANTQFARVLFYLNGSSAATTANTSQNSQQLDIASNANNTAASTFSNVDIYIPSYAGSRNKISLPYAAQEDTASVLSLGYMSALWGSTAAISTITITPLGGGTFDSTSSFFLYGIKNT